MNTLHTDQQEHDEVLELLPWYLNESLSLEESERVQTHLQHCTDCQQEAELLGSALAAANTHATVLLSTAGVNDMNKLEDDRFDNLMARIDAFEAADTSAPLAASGSGLWQKLQSLTTLDWLPGPAWGTAIAASLVVAVVSLQFLRNDISPQAADYQVLSSTPPGNDSPISLRVRFTDSTTTDKVEALLAAKVTPAGRSIAFTVQREDSSGFIISVEKDASVEDLNALLVTLNAEENISSVEVALPAVQPKDK